MHPTAESAQRLRPMAAKPRLRHERMARCAGLAHPADYTGTAVLSTIFFSSGTHEPQLVPHLSLSCSEHSASSGDSAACDARVSAISVSATLKQLQTMRPRALKPCGAFGDGDSSRRPSAATGWP